ncbi:MAG: NAD(P)-binding domain-containing protein [Acidobacteriaceae bacterium]|nr:NAD(P)-binding domain-containing protein [Acidobacteriaceae bacterium]
MQIGILGSGNVGGALGRRWAAAGHPVLFASREPDSPRMAALVASSDIVLLATPWPATRDAVANLPWNGKILIDATNPLLPALAGLEFANTTSGAEQVAAWAPGARVVKAFNTIGYNIMENPTFSGAPVTILYCGDDPEALLWISLAMLEGYGREIAFSLLRRNDTMVS